MRKKALARTASMMEKTSRERRDKLLDEKYELVKKAAENPKYKFRTWEGLVKETHLSTSDLDKVVSSHPKEFVILHRHGDSGQKLITTRKHYNETATTKEKFLGAVLNRVY